MRTHFEIGWMVRGGFSRLGGNGFAPVGRPSTGPEFFAWCQVRGVDQGGSSEDRPVSPDRMG